MHKLYAIILLKILRCEKKTTAYLDINIYIYRERERERERERRQQL